MLLTWDYMLAAQNVMHKNVSSDSALNDSHPGACTVTGHGQDSEGSGKVRRPNMKACINFHSFLVGSATTCLAHVV